jgi:hypothetical protein
VSSSPRIISSMNSRARAANGRTTITTEMKEPQRGCQGSQGVQSFLLGFHRWFGRTIRAFLPVDATRKRILATGPTCSFAAQKQSIRLAYATLRAIFDG